MNKTQTLQWTPLKILHVRVQIIKCDSTVLILNKAKPRVKVKRVCNFTLIVITSFRIRIPYQCYRY